MDVHRQASTILVTALLMLVCSVAGAQAKSSQSSSKTPWVDPLSLAFAEGQPLEPPYSIEVWVDQTLGVEHPGTKTIIETYLREELGSLGQVTLVNGLSAARRPSMLRMRVWYEQWEEPGPYGCFNITLAVVVGKPVPGSASKETVLDSYALAGRAETDLPLLCEKIVDRFDLRILATLRQLRSTSNKR